jgi:methylated-DNA-[protein]-cysteine S-methyltransferase
MAPRLEVADVATPIGTFRVVYEGAKVRQVDLLERGLPTASVPEGAVQRRPPFAAGSPPRQVGEYFNGKRRSFTVDLPLDFATPFDRDVYRALLDVPAGATVTYGELARSSGHGGAARAVGGSMHRNPIPIIIPCHRVVGEDESLTGFGLGLWRKRWLLQREGAWPLKTHSAEGLRDPNQRTLDRSSGRPRTRGRSTGRKPPSPSPA